MDGLSGGPTRHTPKRSEGQRLCLKWLLLFLVGKSRVQLKDKKGLQRHSKWGKMTKKIRTMTTKRCKITKTRWKSTINSSFHCGGPISEGLEGVILVCASVHDLHCTKMFYKSFKTLIVLVLLSTSVLKINIFLRGMTATIGFTLFKSPVSTVWANTFYFRERLRFSSDQKQIL